MNLGFFFHSLYYVLCYVWSLLIAASNTVIVAVFIEYARQISGSK